MPLAKALGPKAHAILVFPKVTKAGLGIGGQYGEGALLKGGKARRVLQDDRRVVRPPGGRPAVRLRDVLHEREGAGALDAASGFEVGVGPSVVFVDEGMAKTTTTTTIKDDIYAFVFGQKGADGGSRHPGQQDHEDHAEVGLGALQCVPAAATPRRSVACTMNRCGASPTK